MRGSGFPEWVGLGSFRGVRLQVAWVVVYWPVDDQVGCLLCYAGEMLPRFGLVSPGAVAALQGGASVLLDMLGVSRSVGVSNSLGEISTLQVDCCGGWGAS